MEETKNSKKMDVCTFAGNPNLTKEELIELLMKRVRVAISDFSWDSNPIWEMLDNDNQKLVITITVDGDTISGKKELIYKNGNEETELNES